MVGGSGRIISRTVMWNLSQKAFMTISKSLDTFGSLSRYRPRFWLWTRFLDLGKGVVLGIIFGMLSAVGEVQAQGGGYGSQREGEIVPQQGGYGSQQGGYGSQQGTGYNTQNRQVESNKDRSYKTQQRQTSLGDATGGSSVSEPQVPSASGGYAGADSCNYCYDKSKSKCEVQCEKIRNRRGFERCAEKCVVRTCEKECGYVSVSESPGVSGGDPSEKLYSDETMLCDYCVRQAEKHSCFDQCRTAFEVGKCVRKCAKRKCASKCQLPGSPIQKGSRRSKPTAHECEHCKRFVKGSCASKCGRNKERPGYIACEVACIEEKCLKKCRPDLFE